MIHGPYCNSITFPTRCRFCGSEVFFFSCDCGSRVFFDELGYPWPIHNCMRSSTAGTSVDTSPSRIPSIMDISIYRGGSNNNLLPGLVHTPNTLSPTVIRRFQNIQNQVREILRIDPLGSEPVEAIGVVQDRLEPDLAKRPGVERGTVGYTLLEKRIGSTNLDQITVLVDELANDPDATDFSSYTFLCPREKLARSISKGAIIRFRLEKLEVLGIRPFWFATSISLIF